MSGVLYTARLMRTTYSCTAFLPRVELYVGCTAQYTAARPSPELGTWRIVFWTFQMHHHDFQNGAVKLYFGL